MAACKSFGMNSEQQNRHAIPAYSRSSSRYEEFYFDLYSEKLEEEMKRSGHLVSHGEYERRKKEIGRHPGFILRDPLTGKFTYFKTEVNADKQAFILSILAKFMNAPEVTLHPISLKVAASLNGKSFQQDLSYAIESQDLTRSYSKAHILKTKKFIPFNRFHGLGAKHFADEKLLLSLAKFILLTRILNLGDFYSGNSGIVMTTTSDGRIYSKLAIVDFDIQDGFQNRYRPIEKLELESDALYLTKIIFQDGVVLGNQLLRRAIAEILHPKLRIVDIDDGYVKVRKGEKGDFVSTIRAVYEDFNHILNGEEFENYIRCLEERSSKIMSLLE